jgi:hypothetical protein
MAIGTNDAIHKFGTQDSIDDGSTSAITDGSFSVLADITSWTNDDDAPQGEIVFKWQYPSGTISAGAGINIYARMMNIQGTNDANTPDATHPHKLLGRIKVDEGLAATTDEYTDPVTILLPNTYSSQVYEFYFQNDTGVTISASWAAWITPKTIGPHA